MMKAHRPMRKQGILAVLRGGKNNKNNKNKNNQNDSIYINGAKKVGNIKKAFHHNFREALLTAVSAVYSKMDVSAQEVHRGVGVLVDAFVFSVCALFHSKPSLRSF